LIANEDQLISLCQKLVQIESLSGKEEAAALFLKKSMLELGFDEVWMDSKGSVIGKIRGSGNGPTLLFDGHIDTVPVSNPKLWQYSPFGGEIHGNRMYGRGTSDMKGAVAAMVVGVSQLKQSGVSTTGDIYVSGTVYEEVFEGVALKDVVEMVRPDLVVIGESTGLNLNIGQRGRAEILVSSKGKTAHSSNPDYGINAIYKMIPFIEGLTKSKVPVHPQLGKGISVVTDIVSSPFPGASVVPDQCRITIDRRLLVHEDEQHVLAQYQALMEDEGFEISIAEQELNCYTGEKIFSRRFYPAWLMDVDHPYVQKSLKALHNIGIEAKLASYQFCTNGSYSAGVAGIPTIGFGPSYEHVAHTVDEYIEIEQLIGAAQGYYSIAKSFFQQIGE
jgi:putative selenium metabolism hydrolase